MDKIKLKKHAILLEEVISSNLGRSVDVDFLASYDPLLSAINDAKKGLISSPLNIGLSRWELESGIRSVKDVSHRLAQFGLLLEGWDLPSDRGNGSE